MLPTRIEEFEGRCSPKEIRACADAILDRYNAVPVRSPILSLAPRDALRREYGDALPAA